MYFFSSKICWYNSYVRSSRCTVSTSQCIITASCLRNSTRSYSAAAAQYLVILYKIAACNSATTAHALEQYTTAVHARCNVASAAPYLAYACSRHIILLLYRVVQCSLPDATHHIAHINNVPLTIATTSTITTCNLHTLSNITQGNAQRHIVRVCMTER
jgi:hypothetical protein